MRRPTFRQLQIFEAIARHKSFTRAGEELCLTQSSVSTQLRQLTDVIGFPLVEQIGKKIYITEMGYRILQFYYELEENWRKFEQDFFCITDAEEGTISVSGVNTAQYLLPRAISIFNKRFPKSNVVLQLRNRLGVLDRMSKNLDDLYILGSPPDDVDIKVIPFLINNLVVVSRPNHMLAQLNDISPRRLGGEMFVFREPGSGTRQESDNFLKENGLSVESQLELSSNEGVKQAVINGAGIAILPECVVALELRLGILSRLNVQGFPIRSQWHIVYPGGKVMAPLVRTFVDFLKQDGREISASSIGVQEVGAVEA